MYRNKCPMEWTNFWFYHKIHLDPEMNSSPLWIEKIPFLPKTLVVAPPEVSFGEGDWDVRPGSAEMLAFADMRDSAEVFFPLTLRLMHWFI